MDTNLPLRTQTVDTATPLNQYVTNVQGDRKAALDEQTTILQQKALKLNMLKTQYEHMDAVRQGRLKGTVIGATLLKPYLDSNNVAGATALLSRMAKDPVLGGDATMMADMLQKGDIKGLQSQVSGLMTAGESLGFLTQIKPEGFSLTPGQSRYDAAGKLIASAPDPYADMFKTTDPQPAVTAPQMGPTQTGQPIAAPTAKPAQTSAPVPSGLVNSTADGEAFLQTLKPETGALVRSIARGDIPLSTYLQGRKPELYNGLVAAVQKYDPSWDNNRHTAVKAFHQGKQGDQVRFFGNVIAHFDTFDKLVDALDNGSVPAINAAANAVAVQTGSAAPTNLDTAKIVISGEVIKAITGSAGALEDRGGVAETIRNAKSPAQLKGAVATFKQLLNGQLHGLDQQYQVSTGRNDFASILTPMGRASYTNQNSGDTSGWKIERIQ